MKLMRGVYMSGGKKRKATDKKNTYDLFCGEVGVWAALAAEFAINCYKRNQETTTQASVHWDRVAGSAAIRFNPKYAFADSSEVKLAAYHEIWHLILSEIDDMLHEYYSDKQCEIAIHRVISKAEKIYLEFTNDKSTKEN